MGLGGVVLVIILSIAFQIIVFSPISPHLLLFPPLLATSANNNRLQAITKVGEGSVEGPEDMAVDKKNNGLLRAGEDGVTLLADEVDGSKIRFADDVVESTDGMVYFTDASTKFELHRWFLDVLEAKPHGRVLKFDPHTGKTSVVLKDLAFANGIALSPRNDFLIVCETWKFRCLKHWLNEDRPTEVFVENLPGGPDNINLAEDGSFWIALLELRSYGTDTIHRSKVAKHIIATFPWLCDWFVDLKKRASVVKVGADGSISHIFNDQTGKVITFVTSALEFDGNLYLGSLNTNFVGKLQLDRHQK
ncbi:hypothetical protein AMTR_s00147p00094600 [Amborella trichopoda]|uniref:Strictosidine synthase conserved region domain-containing protein n=1 Tax=Amborella trichopoda TaxID=13333 RepID=W1PBH7_AMBTC|nr:hypothetical protein AMTR_s00147p00094600 [Amborella trichopoda]